MTDRSRRICLTPTKNEGWIIEKFVNAAALWADNLIVADQGSTDQTLAILRNDPRVQTLINDSPAYDERHRQRILIDHARRIPGRRVLIALDADETLSANAIGSSDWEKIEAAIPGTILRFQWVNVLPGFDKAWVRAEPVAFGFVDDGSSHEGRQIHSPRLPQPAEAPILDLDQIVVLHFQYTIWERMESKQRWYQVWEHLNNPGRSTLDIFRQYNHMFGSWDPAEIRPLRREWIDGYEKAGVGFRDLCCEKMTWWDQEILTLMREHGPSRFRKLAIWDKDWAESGNDAGAATTAVDPRSLREKFSHWLLRATQNHRSNFGVRVFERVLRRCGW